MKPYASLQTKREHQTTVAGHPRYCGGCRRNVRVRERVESKKAERHRARRLIALGVV